MNLDHITAELDEFESFVEEYTSKMNDILKGNAVDIAGAPVQADPKPFVAVSAERATSRLDDESPISVSDSSDQKVAALERTALGPSLRSPPPGGKPQPKKAPSIPRSVQKPGIIDYSHFESISLDDDDDGDKRDGADAIAVRRDAPTAEPVAEPGTKGQPPPPAPAGRREAAAAAAAAKREAALRGYAARLREAGNAQFRAGDWAEAEAQYTAAINALQRPTWEMIDGPAAGAGAGGGGDGEARMEDPFAFLDRLPRLPPEGVRPDAALYTNRAAVRMRLGDFDGAVTDCDEAVVIMEGQASETLKAKWRRAQAFFHLNRLDNAEADMSAVLDQLSKSDSAGETQSSEKAGCTLAEAERLRKTINARREVSKQLKELKDRLADQESLQGDVAAIQAMVSMLLNQIATHGSASIEAETASSALLNLFARPETAAASLEALAVSSLLKSLTRSLSSEETTQLVLPVLATAARNATARLGATENMHPALWVLMETAPTVMKVGALAGVRQHRRIVAEATLEFTAALAECSSVSACGLMLDGAVGRGVGSYGSWAIAKSSASNLLQWGMEEMTKPTSDDEQRTSVALLRLLRAFVNHEPHGLPFLLSTAKISLDALFGLTCSQLSPNAKNDGGNNGAGGLEHVDAACQLLFRLLRAVHTSKAPSVSKNFPSLLRSLVSALTLATQSTNTTATANLLSTLHNLLTVYTGPVDADNVISLGAIHGLIDCCKDTTRELPATAKTTQHQTPSLALTALAKLLSRATTGGGEAAQRLAKHFSTHRLPLRLVERLAGAAEDAGTGSASSDTAAVAQIVAGWLVAGGAEAVEEWEAEGGVRALAGVVQRMSQWVAGVGAAAVEENLWGVVGNVALACGECGRKESLCEAMFGLGALESFVQLLRVAEGQACRKNIAIVCARISQYGPARQRLRETQAIELLYNMGSKLS